MLSVQAKVPQDLQKRTLKTSQLEALVSEWIQNHNPSTKQATYRYKFNLENILPLPENLSHNFILYICYVKFPFVLEDFSVEQKMKKNLFLKSVYQQQFYHGKWKKQFFFEFAMVYLVKTSTKFVAQYFPSLEINQNLEAQLYIILNNVLIGNQIGTKIFHIMSKKYLKPVNPKSPIKASIPKTKKDSFMTICKPSTKYISELMHSQSHGNTKHKILYGKENSNHGYAQNVNPRRNNYRNKISFIKTDSWQKSSLDIFTQQLKRNLYVAPLPVLEPKKMDISEYQQARYGSLEVKDKRILGVSFMKPLNLQTTKITSSMDTLISLNHPTLSSNQKTKPGKILLSRQLNSKHYCLTSCSKYKDSSDKPLAEMFEKDTKSKQNSHKNAGKMSYEEWNQLLGKIRLNSNNLAMFERENQGLRRSLDSASHNQTQNEISYQRTFHKDDSRELKNKASKESTMTRLATQHIPINLTLFNALCNSDPTTQPAQQIQDTEYSKLGKYSTTIDTNNQLHTQVQTQKPSHLLFKKQLSSSQQKLSKTSKLKLARLTFLSECKKRERKLYEARIGGEIRMVMY